MVKSEITVKVKGGRQLGSAAPIPVPLNNGERRIPIYKSALPMPLPTDYAQTIRGPVVSSHSSSSELHNEPKQSDRMTTKLAYTSFKRKRGQSMRRDTREVALGLHLRNREGSLGAKSESPAYEDPSHVASFGGVDSLYRAAQGEIPKKEIQKWLQGVNAYTLHRPVRKKFPTNREGDTVRISKAKLTFEKGYETNWTEELFTVSECVKRDPLVYRVKDLLGENIQGTFYAQELQKPMFVDEPQPGPSRAPMGFGYVETSLTPTNDHVCDVCKKTFSNKSNLKRHMKKHGDHANHACSKCSMKFYRIDKLQEHLKTHEKKKTYSCEQCDRLFSRMSELLHHKRVDHPAPSNHRVRQPRPLARNSRRNALDVFSSDFLTPSPAAKWDFLIFLQEIRQNMHDLLVEELQQRRAIKWYCVSKIRFSRETPDGDIEYCTPYFCSKVVIELDTSMIDDHIEQAFEKIKSSFDEFLENGSF
ncbi:unnamed protein product [Larinioides sclopetarius]|uniref:C2H2-type domain-containing protein n=1 Tax=Larinioides sclopetarius TaxID=280406 RepID=A0AAV1ZKI2_9ARAC